MSSTSDVVRLRKFDGRREDCPVFLIIFEALCGVKKCAEALDPGFARKLPAKESDVTTDADQIEAKKQNAMAMSLLTLAMDSPMLLSKIASSKSVSWPGGLAHVLIAKLNKKYKHNDTIVSAKQTKKLMKLKLKTNQDQEELGDKIAMLEVTYGTNPYH